MENGNSVKIAKLVISIIICQIVGLMGSFFTMPAIDSWYQTINKPIFTPPNWVFAPVWVVMFLLMGVALFFIWDKESKNGEKKAAIVVFVFQFILNILWSFIFFTLKSPIGAFVEIMALWIMVLFTIITFSKVSKTAGYLLLPYIIWVSFAAFLNFIIILIN